MSAVTIVTDRRRPELDAALVEMPMLWTPIATQILTPVPVAQRAGAYTRIKIHEMVKREKVRRAQGTNYQRATHKKTRSVYDCQERGIEEAIDDGELPNYTNLPSYLEVLAGRARNSTFIEQEIFVRDLVHATGTFPLSGNTGHVTSTDWTSAAADIKGDIQTAIAKIFLRSGMAATHIQVSFNTWYNMWKNTAIRAGLAVSKFVETPPPTDQAARRTLAAAVGLQDIVVGNMSYTTSAEGQTGTLGAIWPDDRVFVFAQAQGNDISQPGVGRTFAYTTPDGRGGGIGTSEQYYSDEVRSEVVRFRQDCDEQVIMTECGYLIDTTP